MIGDDPANRQLLMVAAALGQNIGDLWSVYKELFDNADLDKESTRDMLYSLLGELEANLYDITTEVEQQIYDFTGIWEPIPDDFVDDFESSVLTSIANLGNIDLEEYRVEYDDE